MTLNYKKILKALLTLIIFFYIFGFLINTLVSLVEVQKILVEYIEVFSNLLVENDKQLKETTKSILEFEKSKNISRAYSFNGWVLGLNLVFSYLSQKVITNVIAPFFEGMWEEVSAELLWEFIRTFLGL